VDASSFETRPAKLVVITARELHPGTPFAAYDHQDPIWEPYLGLWALQMFGLCMPILTSGQWWSDANSIYYRGTHCYQEIKLYSIRNGEMNESITTIMRFPIKPEKHWGLQIELHKLLEGHTPGKQLCGSTDPSWSVDNPSIIVLYETYSLSWELFWIVDFQAVVIISRSVPNLLQQEREIFFWNERIAITPN